MIKQFESGENGSPHREKTGIKQRSIQRLREALLTPEQAKLAELEKRLEEQLVPPERLEGSAEKPLCAEELSSVLPDALAKRPDQDPELECLLQPRFEKAFDNMARCEPDRVVDVLFPVIGPAIRKSVASALESMVQRINQATEQSLTSQGLRWRIESLRSGVPFSEVVLKNTLRYRVERIFLIHRETSLLLCEVHDPGVDTKDSDMIASMFAAIKEFVQQSFADGRDEGLEVLDFGELEIWIEQGPQAMIASVIRGKAPKQYREALCRAQEKIHAKLDNELREFNGQTHPLQPARVFLENCVRSEIDEAPQRTIGKRSTVGIAAVLAALLAGWAVSAGIHNARWSAFVQELDRQPGVFVVEAKRGKIRGLRDHLAVDPVTLMAKHKLDPDKVDARWAGYVSSDAAIVKIRTQWSGDPSASSKERTPP